MITITPEQASVVLGALDACARNIAQAKIVIPIYDTIEAQLKAVVQSRPANAPTIPIEET